jgi:hypothetical protein
MRLGQPAVLARRLHGRGRLDGVAKCLDRNPRRRSDMLVLGIGLGGVEFGFCRL